MNCFVARMIGVKESKAEKIRAVSYSGDELSVSTDDLMPNVFHKLRFISYFVNSPTHTHAHTHTCTRQNTPPGNECMVLMKREEERQLHNWSVRP